MRLLVSVRDVSEARAAMHGGADIIDIKEPMHGALGKASDSNIAAIVASLQSQRPVSAALGELHENPLFPAVFEQLQWMKVGLAHQCDRDWQSKLITLFANQTHRAVAVAYADHQQANAPTVNHVLQWAIDCKAPVFLIDTFIKDGSTLLDHVSENQLTQWIAQAKLHHIQIALAGSLRGDVFKQVIALQPDIIAVRGAACADHDRTTTVDEQRVRELKVMLADNSCDTACR
jgi:uncharacterized protein (UPF0264 family)